MQSRLDDRTDYRRYDIRFGGIATYVIRTMSTRRVARVGEYGQSDAHAWHGRTHKASRKNVLHVLEGFRSERATIESARTTKNEAPRSDLTGLRDLRSVQTEFPHRARGKVQPEHDRPLKRGHQALT